MTLNTDLPIAIAATRLGLGAKPGELAAMRGDPQGFLLSQITAKGAEQPDAGGQSTADRFRQVQDYQKQRKDAQSGTGAMAGPTKQAFRGLRADTSGDFLARLKLAATTDMAFRERWTLFWANHFTVSASKLLTATLVGPFEQEAIRPNVFGRFEDLLAASSSHPAMLVYLDQAQSVGPGSRVSQAQQHNGKSAGLNENLAREILELHSLGVDAGYSQADVTEFARAMTGWSVGGPRDADDRQGRYVFHPQAHEPGERMILGRRYADDGQNQAREVMKTLAASPHTASHLARKIARHFVADDPPPGLVERLSNTYLAADGNLGAVARALIAAPETWASPAVKFKTPYEFLVSSWRATGTAPQDFNSIATAMTAMGQKPFAAPSPKGWSEEAVVWCAPDAIIKRMTWSESFAAGAIGDRDPLALAQASLGARLTPATSQAVARAETRAEGLAILLMSPEFQRR